MKSLLTQATEVFNTSLGKSPAAKLGDVLVFVYAYIPQGKDYGLLGSLYNRIGNDAIALMLRHSDKVCDGQLLQMFLAIATKMEQNVKFTLPPMPYVDRGQQERIDFLKDQMEQSIIKLKSTEGNLKNNLKVILNDE